MATTPSFFDRKTFGLPRYLLVGLVLACLAGLLPNAAIRALSSNTNKAEDWLPATYAESADLAWFRQYFSSEGFVLCTWDGCTLGAADALDRTAEALRERLDPAAAADSAGAGAANNSPSMESTAPVAPGSTSEGEEDWFRKILTGPELLDELTQPPHALSRSEAIARLEGALIGPPATDAQGNLLDDDTRTTCLVAYLAPDAYQTNQHMRRAIDTIRQVARDVGQIPEESLHLGGPPVDNVAIDMAGENSLRLLSLLSGLVGVTLAYLCFRSVRITFIVVAVGFCSAVLGLAAVYYYGVAEQVLGGLATPHLGTLDAVLMTMPVVVFVLGISGAVHIVNYYRDARERDGLAGAVERGVRIGWFPCTLAAITTAIGLGSLATSDIVPIRKFGAFTAIGVLGTLAILFTLLPVFLHCFPPRRLGGARARRKGSLPAWAESAARYVIGRHAFVSVCGLSLMVLVGLGLAHLQSQVQVLKLLDEDSELVSDYAWIERNIGNLVPMEVVVALPAAHLRQADEPAAANGQVYRMTMFERLEMIRRIGRRVERLPEVSRTLSAATWAPEVPAEGTAAMRRSQQYAYNELLQEATASLLEFVRTERLTSPPGVGRSPSPPANVELWRVSARIAALQDIDYGLFIDELRAVVDPVVQAYRQRDRLVRLLDGQGQQLEGARIGLLFAGEGSASRPDPETDAGLLADLLRESGVLNRVDDRAGAVVTYNVAMLSEAPPGSQQRTAVVEVLRELDALLLVDEPARQAARALENEGLLITDLVELLRVEGSAAVAGLQGGQQPAIGSVYTGIIPVVFKTQRELLRSLRESMAWAVVVIAVVMAFVLRSAASGLVSMIPNVFPIVVVFGALGWLGIKIDIGIMMTASVALGVAVDDTVHFLTWFRRGLGEGLPQQSAVWLAYERCATAMTQTTLIAGLGIVVFVASSFTPTQKFGVMMLTMLSAAWIGDLVLLPALLAGPLGRCFKGGPSEAPPAATGERDREYPATGGSPPKREPAAKASCIGTESRHAAAELSGGSNRLEHAPGQVVTESLELADLNSKDIESGALGLADRELVDLVPVEESAEPIDLLAAKHDGGQGEKPEPVQAEREPMGAGLSDAEESSELSESEAAAGEEGSADSGNAGVEPEYELELIQDGLEDLQGELELLRNEETPPLRPDDPAELSPANRELHDRLRRLRESARRK